MTMMATTTANRNKEKINRNNKRKKGNENYIPKSK